MTHAPPEIILGIDLGTTFSVAAWVDSRGPHVLRDDADDARLPSVIGLDVDSAGRPSVTVGWEARRRAVERPEATVYSIKRLIGKSPDELRQELPFLAYAVKAGPRDAVRVEIAGREYSPEEISSVILRTLKERAEAAIGRPVYKAVITVPAYFDDAQRQATRHAGMAAGLEVVRIINEPTAAALAYGIGLKTGASAAPVAREPVELPIPRCHDSTGPTDAAAATATARTVIVYDLGGGTFDVSILRIDGDVFQVLATAGDTHLGGDDFDRTVITLVQREVADRFGVSIDTPAARQALRTLAESVKIRLSEAETAAIELDLGPERAFHREISRSEFESLIEPLIERTISLCRRALADARLDPQDISEFILVGGSTRIPRVRAAVAELAGKPPYTALNPDEVVAVGAAMQAAVLAGVELDLLLLDVTPLSLGIETMGGAVSKLIMKNSTVPCRAVEQFTTFVDGQTSIQVNVYQGERELTRDCRLLGAFTLSGLPPMPAGIPKVEVEFLIDANGILTVSAREQRSGREAGVQIIPNHGLTREELERIERDSIAHARDDVRAHRRIDLVNQVRFDTHKAEQMLARVGDAFPPDERAAIEHSIRELRALADRAAHGPPTNPDDRDAIPDAPNDLDELQRALNAFGRGTLRLAELGIRTALQDR